MNIKNRINDAILRISQAHYVGSVLQCLKIIPDDSIGTAGVAYHKPLKSIVLLYSPKFFDTLTDLEVDAVLKHEIDHILRKHIFIYNNLKTRKSDAKRLNIAMDIVINQHIPNIPKQGIFLEHFKDKNGKLFPKNESTETYYDLLEDASYNNPNTSQSEPQEMDKHYWDDIENNEILEATTELIKRAQYVYEKSHSSKCKEFEDLLQELTKIKTDIDYKSLLKSFLRSTIPSKDVKKTWIRPSRRFGLIAKGSKIKNSPSVSIYGDTSGSMGYDELNSSFGVIADVIKNGVSKINLHLFHHNLYDSMVYKKTTKITENQIQSGGTDLADVVEKIKNSQDEIHIILTDGHYSTNTWDKSLNSKKVVFLIRQGGNLDHPLKGLGKTLEYKNV
jgi:predicted metal-dependent peptidase